MPGGKGYGPGTELSRSFGGSMEIVLRVGTISEFFATAKEIAVAGDTRQAVALPQSRLSLVFETQEDVDNAIASAWVHTHEPQSFLQFTSFAHHSVDPLYDRGRDVWQKIDRAFHHQPPWIRRESEGGMDTRGTIGVTLSGQPDLAVLPICVRLAFEHLAFLSRFVQRQDGIEIKVTPDRRVYFLFSIDRRSKLGMYVQMQPQDDPLIEGLERVIHRGGDVVILVPKTIDALETLDEFRGGLLNTLPLEEMLETRLSFSARGHTAGRVSTRRLTAEEIESVGPVPAAMGTSVELAH